MSLVLAEHSGIVRRFPRVSGDEPGGTDDITNLRPFSPRERG